jgi:hypothetical protein
LLAVQKFLAKFVFGAKNWCVLRAPKNMINKMEKNGKLENWRVEKIGELSNEKRKKN